MRKLFLFFIACAMIVPATSFAASDGQKGETSEGSAVITLRIPEMIIATGFDDIDIIGEDELAPGTTPNNYLTATEYVRSAGICVASNNKDVQANKYKVKVSNDNNSGTAVTDYFVKDTGSSDKVWFNLNYSDKDGTAQDLKEGTDSTAYFTAYDVLNACDSGSATDNATYTVTFKTTGGTSDRPSIDMVPAGQYTATLTFLLTPINENSTDY